MLQPKENVTVTQFVIFRREAAVEWNPETDQATDVNSQLPKLLMETETLYNELMEGSVKIDDLQNSKILNKIVDPMYGNGWYITSIHKSRKD